MLVLFLWCQNDMKRRVTPIKQQVFMFLRSSNKKNLIVILSTHSTLNFFRSYRETVVVRSHRSIFRFLFSKGTINAGHAAAHQFLNFFFFQLQTANVSRASFFFVLMLHISPLHTIHFSSKFICFITVYFSLSFFVFIFKKKCAVRFV